MLERHQGSMSAEDAATVRASKKLFTRSIVCVECGSIVYAYRDDAGRPRLIEHTDRRTVNSKYPVGKGFILAST